MAACVPTVIIIEVLALWVAAVVADSMIVEIRSCGGDDPGYPCSFISLTNPNPALFPESPEIEISRGHTIVVLDQFDGRMIDNVQFDSWGDATNNMTNFLRALEHGQIVLVTVSDSGDVFANGSDFATIGAVEPLVPEYRESWALAGRKGGNVEAFPWISQDSHLDGEGPAELRVEIPLLDANCSTSQHTPCRCRELFCGDNWGWSTETNQCQQGSNTTREELLLGGCLSAQIPFSDDFESGELGFWWSTSSIASGRIRVGTEDAHSGNFSALLDSSKEQTQSLAQLILTANLTKTSSDELFLVFWWREFHDEADSQDGVFLSDDLGLTWKKVFPFSAESGTSYRSEVIELPFAVENLNLTLNDHFQIMFQFSDNNPIPDDGYSIDDVQIFASAVLPSFCIQTTVDKHGNAYGFMFDVIINERSDVVITDIAQHFSRDGQVEMLLFITKEPGSYLGHESDSSAWMLVGNSSIYAQESDALTDLGMNLNITLSKESRFGFYITMSKTSATTAIRMPYTLGDQFNQSFITDQYISITEGKSNIAVFQDSFGGEGASRIWNGRLCYRLAQRQHQHTEPVPPTKVTQAPHTYAPTIFTFPPKEFPSPVPQTPVLATSALITSAPTTSAPTTSAPTIFAPTTFAPISSVPETFAPAIPTPAVVILTPYPEPNTTDEATAPSYEPATSPIIPSPIQASVPFPIDQHPPSPVPVPSLTPQKSPQDVQHPAISADCEGIEAWSECSGPLEGVKCLVESAQCCEGFEHELFMLNATLICRKVGTMLPTEGDDEEDIQTIWNWSVKECDIVDCGDKIENEVADEKIGLSLGGALGILVAVIVVVAVMIYVCFRRKQTRANDADMEDIVLLDRPAQSMVL